MHLVAPVNYAPKLRKIIDRGWPELNATALTLPVGSSRELRLRLTRKKQIEVQVRDLDQRSRPPAGPLNPRNHVNSRETKPARRFASIGGRIVRRLRIQRKLRSLCAV